MPRALRRVGTAGALAGILGLALLVMPAPPASAANETVHKWLTTSDLSQHLTQQTDLGFSASSGSGTISVDNTQKFQSIVGFGAAMTDSSAWLLSDKLSSTAHTNLMNALFSPSQGIGMSWVRVPMGSSDFSATAQPYSYDDNLSASTGTTVGVGSGRCLDDTGNTANGTQIYIWDCTSGNANQQFAYTSASELQVAGKCLDANGKGTANGTKVILWTCNGQANQQWKLNTNGSITGVQSGLCLDVSGAATANGSLMQLWACNGATNQRWTRPDPALANFSIAHDLQYIVPDLKEALALNPGLKLMANPWSPPGWMKTNGQMNNVNNAGSLLPASYGPLAQYFVKFLQGYAAQGIPIAAITPQNEPSYATAYPGMQFSEQNEADFIANNLGPALAQANLSPALLGTDFNTNVLSDYAEPLMQNANAAKYLAGTSWHCYAGGLNAISTMQAAFPTKDNYETECSDGIDPQNAIETFIQSTRNSARTATMWNIVQDQNNGPVIPGGCNACTPLVTVNQSTGNVTYDAGYYSVGHFSKFVLPGAKRIASTTTANLDNVAFQNPDGSLVLIVDNTSSSTQSFSTSWGGQKFSDSLPGHGIATYEWKPA
ncbi:Ricin B lectin [Catenulispora acidiphila DSM 44928]|uniref:Ricin B lectin n=1 Tax=Catenulispora acidiphila (strain DSM 44928 / JCM 14897 / NBRC 102108 / NRRL B-24433 / ID139908) TaxID=479433 RepID=C7Q330_CATAD|nr:ricin-type beta-trefoil lectin domain protein [Catenulispora acidiphila]ACU73766.1 Ricin B lectin [Catenulispora acidiphila DSM 44928]